MKMFGYFGTKKMAFFFSKNHTPSRFSKMFDNASLRSGCKDKPISIRDVYEFRKPVFTR